jgi:hypothetical protein
MRLRHTFGPAVRAEPAPAAGLIGAILKAIALEVPQTPNLGRPEVGLAYEAAVPAAAHSLLSAPL